MTLTCHFGDRVASDLISYPVNSGRCGPPDPRRSRQYRANAARSGATARRSHSGAGPAIRHPASPRSASGPAAHRRIPRAPHHEEGTGAIVRVRAVAAEPAACPNHPPRTPRFAWRYRASTSAASAVGPGTRRPTERPETCRARADNCPHSVRGRPPVVPPPWNRPMARVRRYDARPAATSHGQAPPAFPRRRDDGALSVRRQPTLGLS